MNSLGHAPRNNDDEGDDGFAGARPRGTMTMRVMMDSLGHAPRHNDDADSDEFAGARPGSTMVMRMMKSLGHAPAQC